jgi:hypothetical protein
MQVRLLSSVPRGLQPLRTYETTYLYVGFGRYDTERKTLTKLIEQPNGILEVQETPFDASIFPRAYHAEMVRVSVYSESPHLWSETVDDQTFVFQQQTD